MPISFHYLKKKKTHKERNCFYDTEDEKIRERERSEEKAENKKRPDVDKFHVTVLRRSFVCVKISYLGSLSLKRKKKQGKINSFSL